MHRGGFQHDALLKNISTAILALHGRAEEGQRPGGQGRYRQAAATVGAGGGGGQWPREDLCFCAFLLEELWGALVGCRGWHVRVSPGFIWGDGWKAGEPEIS